MSLALLLTSLVLSHPIGTVVRHRVGPLSFELPGTWRQSSRLGTVQFDAPDGDAYLLIDANRVDAPNLTPEACMDVILKRLAAGPSWRRKTVDVFAIAHEITFERSPDLGTQARVERMVGCDGQYSWSMVFFIEAAVWTYYSQVTAHVIETLRGSGLKPSPGPVSLEDLRGNAPAQ